MIVRYWKGVTKPGKSGEYIAHLKIETLPQLQAIPGFLRAGILSRDVADGQEFLVLTEWASMEAIRQFAGSDPERAVVPPKARSLLLRFDDRVQHFEEVFSTQGPLG